MCGQLALRLTSHCRILVTETSDIPAWRNTTTARHTLTPVAFTSWLYCVDVIIVFVIVITYIMSNVEKWTVARYRIEAVKNEFNIWLKMTFWSLIVSPSPNNNSPTICCTLHYTQWVKKNCATIHLFITSTNVGWFSTFSLLYSPRNLQQNPCHVAHHTLDVSLHYLAKLEKF